MANPPDPANDPLWSTLGTQQPAPSAAPAATSAPPAPPAATSTPPPPAQPPAGGPPAPQNDPMWSTLGTGKDASPDQTAGTAPPPASIGATLYSSFLRGIHEGTDVPAEALAGAADWVARKFGYNTNQLQQTRAADVAFNQPYDVNPANQLILPTAARIGGNLLTTIGPGLLTGGLAGEAVRAGIPLLTSAAEEGVPAVGTALRYLPSAITGAAGGAAVSAQTGQPIGSGAATGAVLGAALPAARDIGNAVLASRNPAVAQAVTQFGIPLRAGQVADSRIIRYLDDITAPESSNIAQRAAVTTDAARSMGVTPEIAAANNLPAGQVTPATMQLAKDLNGGVMNDVENRTTIDGPPLLGLASDLRNIADDAAKTPSVFQDIKPHIQDVIDTITKNNGVLPGTRFGDLIATGSPLDVATNSNNSVVQHYAGQIKEALRDAMQLASTPEDAARYAQARLQYHNMMALAPIVNKGIPGQISPLLLQGAANRSFTNNAFQGAGQLGQLGDVAQQFLKTPPQSGTEPRQLVRATLYGRLEDLGKFLASVTAKPLVQTALGANPLTPFGAVIPGAAGRLVPAAAAARNALQSQPQ